MNSAPETASSLRRGCVVLAELDPAIGNEQGKTRPGVIVSNDAANVSAARSGRGVVTIVPITSNVSTVYSFQCLLQTGQSGLTRLSKAQAEQVRSIAVGRVVRLLGWLDGATMRQVDDALRVHLSL